MTCCYLVTGPNGLQLLQKCWSIVVDFVVWWLNRGSFVDWWLVGFNRFLSHAKLLFCGYRSDRHSRHVVAILLLICCYGIVKWGRPIGLQGLIRIRHSNQDSWNRRITRDKPLTHRIRFFSRCALELDPGKRLDSHRENFYLISTLESIGNI